MSDAEQLKDEINALLATKTEMSAHTAVSVLGSVLLHMFVWIRKQCQKSDDAANDALVVGAMRRLAGKLTMLADAPDGTSCERLAQDTSDDQLRM